MIDMRVSRAHRSSAGSWCFQIFIVLSFSSAPEAIMFCVGWHDTAITVSASQARDSINQSNRIESTNHQAYLRAR